MQEGSTLDISDTCLLNNNFTGTAPIIAVGDVEINAANNYGTMDDAVECQFIAQVPQLGGNATCLDYDLAECS